MINEKNPILINIDQFPDVALHSIDYKDKDIQFSSSQSAKIEDEIIITENMNLAFDFRNEITCKKIKIVGCQVEIQGLNLRGSIVVENGILRLTLSAIHDISDDSDYLLSIQNIAGVHASKCFFTDSPKFGLSVDNCSAMVLEGCQIKNTKYAGICATSNSILSCESCLISDTGRDTIFSEGNCRITIRSTKISEGGNRALAGYNVKNLVIENSVIKNIQQGALYVSSCPQVLIESSQFSDIEHTALYFERSKVVLKKSAFLNCNGNGINASQSTTAIISSSSFKSMTFPPISICQSSVGMIKKCNISDSQMSGIIVRTNSVATIKNCNIENIEHFGVAVSDSESVKIDTSLFVGCKYSCLGCYNHSFVALENSYLIGPGKYGADIFTGGQLVSNDTTFIGLSESSIYCHHGGSAHFKSPLFDQTVINKAEDVNTIINRIDITKRGGELNRDKIFKVDTKREFQIGSGFVVGVGPINVMVNENAPNAQVEKCICTPKCLLCGKNDSVFFINCGHSVFCQDCIQKLNVTVCPLCLMQVDKSVKPIQLSPEGENPETCGICFTNRTDIVIMPCGHTICSECAQHHFANSNYCPFCREGYARPRRIVAYE
ncbi:hypothetical protein TVAG_204930 [Trichomonas vaginalis G3]|uniref:RING-type domain-containing protein n=1 Tax=Trichomonas vaginalis (strain ATCC PRA-98 / G3) TaxID=412133 RepID=A2EIZ6_TRIV3|nr:pectin lyase-like family [Trichomonas vaginalis G3]EAY07386.1 hypothetical protein TVAG_204930 [Trichomonas vaginalis G3]KAI5506539.1 pectin lyase-like family [Trichomonas vaginalis G3]|eukprot:XP_001319609.1 hypothetical protein [Trichomonas vaginalis G3]